MSLELHLRPDERIISNFGPYYATSTRVILFLEKDTGEEVYELPYSHLEKIEEVRVANHRRMIIGTLMVLGGFFSAYLMGLIIPLLAVAVGLFLIIQGGIGKIGYYQLYGRGMTTEDLYRWQIRYFGAGSLIASIRTIVGDR